MKEKNENKSQLKRQAIACFCLLFSILLVSAGSFQEGLNHSVSQKAASMQDGRAGNQQEVSLLVQLEQDRLYGKLDAILGNMVVSTDETITVLHSMEELGERYIRLEKGAEKLHLELNDFYMEKKIGLRIGGFTDIQSARSGEISFYDKQTPEQQPGSVLEDVCDFDRASVRYKRELLLKMDHIYCCQLFEDETFYYIRLSRPKEVYKNVLVVDAGHGGTSTGTYSAGKKYSEKGINQNVTGYLKKRMDGLLPEGVKVYYTRLGDQEVPLAKRVWLSKEIQADFFISIHCNGDTGQKAAGTESLYAEGKRIKKEKGSFVTSKELADACQKKLVATMGLADRGTVRRNDLYLLRKTDIPAVILELGFMSNPADMSYLKKKENQIHAAGAIFSAVKEVLEKGGLKESGRY